MINKTFFYDSVRKTLFGGKLTQNQVLGLDTIINEFDAKYSKIGLNCLAYTLGTVYHEVDKKMMPIEEYGKGKKKSYGVFLVDKNKKKYGLKMGKGPGKRIPYYEPKELYYGRGFVQLTWYENYEKAGLKLKLDLLKNPSLALDIVNATDIMFEGMIEGWFTTRKLSQYFKGERADWVNARKIINGLDKANTIADYAKLFRAALKLE